MPVDASEARASNLAALRLHRAGDFAGAESAWAALAAEEPRFAVARFNQACALVRLERLDDAALVLEVLLREDLPSFGPRLLADEDLAALRASPQGERLLALREALAAPYREAARVGTPVVWASRDPLGEHAEWYEERFVHRAVQAGVWLPEQHRFVPMGPKLSLERDRASSPARTSHLSALFDPQQNTVIAISAYGLDAEDGDYLAQVRVHAWEAGTGLEYASEQVACPDPGCMWPKVAALAHGVRVQLTNAAVVLDGEPGAAVIEHTYGEPGGASEGPRLACGQSGCTTERTPPPGVAAAVRQGRVAVTFAEHEVLLDAAHPRTRGTRTLIVGGGADALYVASIGLQYCEDGAFAGRAAVSRVNLREASAELLTNTRGPFDVVSGPDGALYIQEGQRVSRRVGESSELLPEGLLLSPALPIGVPAGLPCD